MSLQSCFLICASILALTNNFQTITAAAVAASDLSPNVQSVAGAATDTIVPVGIAAIAGTAGVHPKNLFALESDDAASAATQADESTVRQRRQLFYNFPYFGGYSRPYYGGGYGYGGFYPSYYPRYYGGYGYGGYPYYSYPRYLYG